MPAYPRAAISSACGLQLLRLGVDGEFQDGREAALGPGIGQGQRGRERDALARLDEHVFGVCEAT